MFINKSSELVNSPNLLQTVLCLEGTMISDVCNILRAIKKFFDTKLWIKLCTIQKTIFLEK